MAGGDPWVSRVIDYGGDVTEDFAGGRAVEYWAVVNLACNQIAEAHNLGLPRLGTPNPDPRLSFVGPVKAIQRVQEFGATGWLARVIYSSAGSFSAIRLGSETTNGEEYLTLPCIQRLGGTPVTYFKTDGVAIPRPIFRRCITTRYSGDIEGVSNVFEDNVGKLYAPDAGSWIFQSEFSDTRQYQLSKISILTDAGNNSIIRTTFMRRGQIGAIASGKYPGQDVAIPKLPANAFYVPNARTGTIGVTNPFDYYELGENLFWL